MTDSKNPGRDNKLAGQIGEFLVCAELGRRGLIATPFAGNVPNFDIVVADEACNTLPLQVRTSRGTKWPASAKHWMDIEFDAVSKTQQFRRERTLEFPDLIYVHVALAEPSGRKDQFFILTKAQLQAVVIKHYFADMDPRGWRRPKNPESYDVRYGSTPIYMQAGAA